MLAKIKADPITFVLGFLGSLAVAAQGAPGWSAASTGGKVLLLLESAVPIVFGYFSADAKPAAK